MHRIIQSVSDNLTATVHSEQELPLEFWFSIKCKTEMERRITFLNRLAKSIWDLIYLVIFQVRSDEFRTTLNHYRWISTRIKKYDRLNGTIALKIVHQVYGLSTNWCNCIKFKWFRTSLNQFSVLTVHFNELISLKVN